MVVESRSVIRNAKNARRKRVQLIQVIFARILVGVEGGIYGGIFFKPIVRFY